MYCLNSVYFSHRLHHGSGYMICVVGDVESAGLQLTVTLEQASSEQFTFCMLYNFFWVIACCNTVLFYVLYYNTILVYNNM